ncbi:hypothetical protein FB451DRAFT_1549486 [Mycena latifolia]|nr:hypothetical protein FB451DRAFT_1549486 [Mycena latifolia]
MLLILGFSVSLTLHALHAEAQQASLSWRKPTLATSREGRISIAGAGLQTTVNLLDSTAQFPGESYGVAGSFYSQLAEFDFATNESTYRDNLTQYFLLASEHQAVNFSGEFVSEDILMPIGDGLNYGHAAAIAYKTYNDSVFLKYAAQSWWWGRLNTLSQDELNIGNITSKNFTVQKACQAITMAGGTFWTQDPTSSGIVGLSTGGFLVYAPVIVVSLSLINQASLSALLAEATSDAIYLEAATQSADFIHAHLYNVRNMVQDGIDARANMSCSIASVEASYNSGLMIEGLAILYSITHNSSIHDLISEIITAAIPNNAWQESDGIIANGDSKLGDMFLPRGLAAAYVRNATTPELQSYIGEYLSVQFNAVIDLATNGSNIYEGTWTGPPSGKPSGANQTNALQALISTINLYNQTSVAPVASASPSLTASPSPTPSMVPKKSTKIAPIIGGIVGGLVLFIGITGWAILRGHLRPRTTSRQSLFSLTPTATPTIHPFDIQRTNSHPPLVRAEKLGRGSLSSSPSEGSPTGGSGETLVTPTSAELPTGELVRLLYQRMHNHTVENREGLPDYVTM